MHNRAYHIMSQRPSSYKMYMYTTSLHYLSLFELINNFFPWQTSSDRQLCVHNQETFFAFQRIRWLWSFFQRALHDSNKWICEGYSCHYSKIKTGQLVLQFSLAVKYSTGLVAVPIVPSSPLPKGPFNEKEMLFPLSHYM